MVKFWLGPGTRTGTRSFSRPDMNAVAGSRPLWEAPTNLLPNLPAALYQSNLFLLEDAFAAQAVINGRREILQEKVTPGDEYNAALLCFSQGSSLPQKLFLKFDAPGAKTSTWMFPAAKFLFCGLENPFNLAPAGVGSGGNSKAGVWMVPLSEIERSVTAQRQAELARGEQARRAVDQFQKNFLAKYDRNHNGILDPEEKEKAMEDPDYVKFAVNLMRADRERAKDRDTPNDLPRGKTP